ncbi:hypothetical protein F5Y12DRAFT_767327 [Xylaria sp. FL1777]|nr:hypothetical protein F5Y12DRAFT_767327 [Xylaria sp. FL1777]
MSVSNSTSNAHRPASPPPAASWPQASVTPATKLRDSCHPCALSKVKCHREKPSCSRCLRRGIACAYVATRRGRKHTAGTTSHDKTPPRPSITEDAIHLRQHPGMPHSLDKPVPHNFDVVQTGPFNSDASHLIAATSDLDFTLFSHLLGPESQPLSPLSTDIVTDFGAFNLALSATDTSGADVFSDMSLFESPSTDSSAASDVVCNEIVSTADPLNPAVAAAIPTGGETYCSQAPWPADASYNSCLEYALGLMQTLVPINRTRESGASPTIPDIIDKNKKVLAIISSMMQCSCSNDGYLLAVVSLIIFKVLSRYNMMLRNIPLTTGCHGRHNTTLHTTSSSARCQQDVDHVMVGNHLFPGEDQDRMKAQLVLGELHRVQSLMNQLSLKLKSLAAKKRESRPCTGGHVGADEMPSISALVIDQVGTDLRKRLQWLSKHIIEGLNKE